MHGDAHLHDADGIVVRSILEIDQEKFLAKYLVPHLSQILEAIEFTLRTGMPSSRSLPSTARLGNQSPIVLRTI